MNIVIINDEEYIEGGLVEKDGFCVCTYCYLGNHKATEQSAPWCSILDCDCVCVGG